MEQLKKEQMERIAPLFQGWQETMIWSCLEGYMGRAWTDCLEKPTAAQVVVGDFCFFGGEPKRELIRNIPGDHPGEALLMIPGTSRWAGEIEKAYGNACEKISRYAIKKEPDVFRRDKLLAYVNRIPADYQIEMIDERMYELAKKEEWSRDLCSQFSSWDSYRSWGLGAGAMEGDRLVAGASSYTVYSGGIEIEIDTREEYRRKGLALACGAKLILECLRRGLYPSWDAHDLRSVALAEKLGYHRDREYTAYVISI